MALRSGDFYIDELGPSDRIEEIAEILATGYLRLQAQKAREAPEISNERNDD